MRELSRIEAAYTLGLDSADYLPMTTGWRILDAEAARYLVKCDCKVRPLNANGFGKYIHTVDHIEKGTLCCVDPIDLIECTWVYLDKMPFARSHAHFTVLCPEDNETYQVSLTMSQLNPCREDVIRAWAQALAGLGLVEPGDTVTAAHMAHLSWELEAPVFRRRRRETDGSGILAAHGLLFFTIEPTWPPFDECDEIEVK